MDSALLGARETNDRTPKSFESCSMVESKGTDLQSGDIDYHLAVLIVFVIFWVLAFSFLK